MLFRHKSRHSGKITSLSLQNLPLRCPVLKKYTTNTLVTKLARHSLPACREGLKRLHGLAFSDPQVLRDTLDGLKG